MIKSEDIKHLQTFVWRNFMNGRTITVHGIDVNHTPDRDEPLIPNVDQLSEVVKDNWFTDHFTWENGYWSVLRIK